jgi:uncharacterized low-complexity protein
MKLSTLGLRGVAANILWLWANYYKKIEDWDKLEMTVNQIIRLQPNFVEVWDFQAHNLSYNVSVEFDDYRMRYQWVKKGIEFLILGTHYNRDEPGLLSQIGWFTGQKVGRADEQKQFRRLFRDDKDFHQVFRTHGVDVDQGLGQDGKPDNWLVARLWYDRAVDAVTFSGKPIRGRTPLLFYSGGPMAQINGSAAMQKDGYFFEAPQRAWERAYNQWISYGNRELPTSAGFTIHLNDKEAVDERIRLAYEELEKLCPGARQEIEAEKRAKLTFEQRAALDKPMAERTPDEYSIAYEAEQSLKVLPRDFLSKVSRENRPRVRQLVDQIEEDERTSLQINLNRRIVNFEYWRTRCEVDRTNESQQAQKDVYDADLLFSTSGEKLTEARELYERAWRGYAAIYEKHPTLMENAEAQDLVDSVGRYKDLLGQLDEPFPADFPLWKLMEQHEKGRQIRDQVRLLQGAASVGEKPKEAARSAEPAKSDAESKASDQKSAEPKAGESKAGESKAAGEPKSAEPKSAEPKSAEPKPAESKAADEKKSPTEPPDPDAGKKQDGDKNQDAGKKQGSGDTP